jgi:hypothetical protein
MIQEHGCYKGGGKTLMGLLNLKLIGCKRSSGMLLRKDGSAKVNEVAASLQD